MDETTEKRIRDLNQQIQSIEDRIFALCSLHNELVHEREGYEFDVYIEEEGK